MENFDTFLNLLKEEVGDTDIWDINDVEPISQSQDGQEGEGEGQGEGDQEGEGEGEGQGEGTPGDQEGEGEGTGTGGEKTERGEKGAETDIGDTLKKIAEGDGDQVNDSLDDHSILEKGDSSVKDVVKRVWQEVEGEYRKREMQQGGSGSGGGFATKVKEFLKEDLNIGKIIKRISKFKREVGEEKKSIETYDAALFGPVPHQTDIMMKGNITSDERDEKSVVLFFAADTSGSITKQDYESIFGYINEIARKFKEKEYGVSGEVYLIEWGSNVERMRKWEHVTKIDAPDVDATLADGGGTDVQNVFNYLNKHFVEKDDEGNYYFVFSDNMKNISKPKKKKSEEGKAIKAKLKKPKKDSKLEPQDMNTSKVKEGQANILEGTFSVAPFLIFYTDGFFSKPTNLGPLFRDNPGNILYIVTSKEGIRNLKPKNFVYHDLHGDNI